MKIIVALGNPGSEYAYTRHNLGFLLLDRFHSSKGCSPFVKLKGALLSLNNWEKDNQYILCKPLEFMNNSGSTLFKVLCELNLNIEDVLLIYDELDIPLGKYKISQKQSKVIAHRGVWDVESKYPLKNILKLKVGIGPEKRENLIIREFVMHNFEPEEFQLIAGLEPKLFLILEKFISLSEREMQNPINYLSRSK